MNKIISYLLLVFLSFSVSGCMESVPVDDTLPVMEVTTVDGERSTTLEQVVDIENGMRLKTVYETGDYDLARWRITDSKTISMLATVENIPDRAEVFVEHVHIDVSLKSTEAGVDGWQQDTMDDSFHGVSQDGFCVTQYPYSNIFAIQGYSQTLIHFWDGYGGEYRMTESGLRNRGVYANKLQVIYDLLIKYDGEDYYHVVSVKNEFLIPVYKEAKTELAPAGTH